MFKLSKTELRCLETILDGEPLSSLGDGSAQASSRIRRVFDDARSKLARGTAYYQMPEHAFECDYSLKWFKVHPKEGRAVVERYQKAAAAAESAFWSARGGIAEPQPDGWNTLDD